MAFLGDLSPGAAGLRFFATVRPDAHLIDPYLEPDWAPRGALIGALTEGGDERRGAG